jgi:hypothetical protein
MLQIPNKENKKWEELVTGKLDVKITNFFLRTKVDQIIEDTKRFILTTEQAIEDIYNLCIELSETRDITADLESIFGNLQRQIFKPQQTPNPSFVEKENPTPSVNKDIDKTADDTKKKVPEQKEEKNDSNVSAKIDSASEAKRKIREMEAEKEKLRTASIERRNREIKKEIEKMKKTSKKSFFRSLFE